MGYDIERRRGAPPGRRQFGELAQRYDYQQAGMLGEQRMTEAFIRSQAEITDYAMLSVAMLKRNQNTLETMVPDAAELLGLIASTAAMNIARRVAGYGNGF